ncbi:GNAT family N-acetyltransferase [Alkaliphilus peptidifermentans]|uniref:Ribosomal-protein-serine acetyltransferase n=1 Tax=Alkaliphilus peptidifermentans DSM 18978 TaxID=1120976 RepID=A0A1G5I1S5_9FIRM|nr:GNAT family protein [Alkaliphilus peptidifermentans]SCY69510.1 ribosomal-protein-serine acetyltransferase [Alkaliphilus peptidifermentans DSM 18978]
MFKHIINNDIQLKLLELNDAEELTILTDECKDHLRQWLPWVDSSSSIDDRRAFIEMTKKQYAANDGFQAGIWYKGQIAGVIGFHSINWSNKSTSIGYWLGDKFQGNGIMTKATIAFIDYALKELKLNRVEIRCAEENLKSRAIPERLGFTKEGVIRQAEWLYHHYVNHVVYGMLAEEWKQSL